MNLLEDFSMNDFAEIKNLLREFCEKVKQLEQNKVGNYSAKLEIPAWRDGNDFAKEVSGNVGRFTGRLVLLENSQIPVENTKAVLTDVSKKITENLNFYTKQWVNKNDKEFCNNLAKSLQNVSAVIANYSRPNQPHP
jgi:hypothetical protein